MSNFPLQDAAEHLAQQGRYGDSMLVHMNPIEVNAISKMSPTGQLTINPQTGQPEAFLPLLFSMMAPSVMGALGASAMSPLVASAIGSGLGTVAEGGSLQEGLSAGLMSGITGGLLKNIGGGDILGGAGTEAATEAAKTLPDVSTLEKLTEATGGTPYADIKDAGLFSKLKTGFGNIPSSMGLSQGMIPDPAAGTGNIAADAMIPSALSRGQAFMGQAVPSLAAGMVGEMYVPEDMGGFEEEESPYQYEGPYKPTEQRSMIGQADPFASAFGGEQDMIGGNVFPPGFNMRYGGLVKRLEKGGMPKAQQQIEESAATLATRAQDQRIRDYQRSIMAAPTVDPRRDAYQFTGEEEFIPRTDETIFTGEEEFVPRMDNITGPIHPSLVRGEGPRMDAASLREFDEALSGGSGLLPSYWGGEQPLQAPTMGEMWRESGRSFSEAIPLNTKYNPLIYGARGVSALFGKGILEAMEAIDESKRRKFEPTDEELIKKYK